MAGLNPPRKRRRTSDVPATLSLLHRIKQSMPRISATAFASMCQFAQHMALPNCDRNMVRKARDEVLGQDTPFGALIRKVPVKDHKGNIINISISHPIPFFWLAARTTYLGALLERTHAQTPSTPQAPWSLLYYSDEVVPGNALKSQNHKKVQVVYYTFEEFGPDAIAKEEFWFTFTVLRSSVVNQIEGGMSQVLVQTLLAMFGGEHNLTTSGMRIETKNGVEIRLFVKFKLVPSDEAALSSTWSCKGASGVKMCLLCMNIVNKRWIGLGNLPRTSCIQPFHLVTYRWGVEEGAVG